MIEVPLLQVIASLSFHVIELATIVTLILIGALKDDNRR